jgi:hypothetical protein
MPVPIIATEAVVFLEHPDKTKGRIEAASRSTESPNRVEEKAAKPCRYGRVNAHTSWILSDSVARYG